MAISAEALFHFKTKFEYVIDILKHEFRPRFCLENYNFLSSFKKIEKLEYAIPMVCFCDIPLSDVREHIDIYGNYGIGMRKDWGIKNRLNPILYISPKSDFKEYLVDVLAMAQNSTIEKSEINKIIETLNFIKPYEGPMLRNESYINKKFYNEREWRYVPNMYDLIGPQEDYYYLTKPEFLNSEKKDQANKKLYDKVKLPFEPEDIKYIIVKEEKEILPMINEIKNIKVKYNDETVALLSSRIITVEQIYEDF